VAKYSAFPYLLFLKHIALSLKNKVLSFTKTKEFHTGIQGSPLAKHKTLP
jgi:hypothetical protein